MTSCQGHGLAAAVVVEREGHVAEAGQALGPALGVLVEPRSLVGDQHGRARAGLLVVDRQVPDQLQPVDFVLDVLDAHERPLSSGAIPSRAAACDAIPAARPPTERLQQLGRDAARQRRLEHVEVALGEGGVVGGRGHVHERDRRQVVVMEADAHLGPCSSPASRRRRRRAPRRRQRAWPRRAPGSWRRGASSARGQPNVRTLIRRSGVRAALALGADSVFGAGNVALRRISHRDAVDSASRCQRRRVQRSVGVMASRWRCIRR